MSGGINGASGISATKIQLYTPATIALILSLISMIIGIILLLHSQDQGDASNIVKTIATAGGFKGNVSDNKLTLQTTSLGILTGPGLLKAQSADITFVKLSGFNNVNPATTITSSDTIKSSLEKILLLNITPLIGLIPSASPITDTDTVFDAVNQLSGSILNSVNPFCVYTPITTNSQTKVNLWGDKIGTSIFPANTINSGTVLELQIFGDVTGPSSGETATYILELDGNDFITITSAPTSTAAVTRDIQLLINISFDESNIYFTAKCMLLNHPSQLIFVSTTSVVGQTLFNRSLIHVFGFAGYTSADTMSTTIRSSICTSVAGIQ